MSTPPLPFRVLLTRSIRYHLALSRHAWARTVGRTYHYTPQPHAEDTGWVAMSRVRR